MGFVELHRRWDLRGGSFRGTLVVVAAVVLATAGASCVAYGIHGSQTTDRPEPRLSANLPPSVARVSDTQLLLPPSVPVRIGIRAIGVSSALLRLGTNSDGTMQVPPRGPDYDKAGWYRHSPTPGERGPAVIAGHVDSARDGRSVFFRLGSLAKGDLVDITRADALVATFRVDAVLRFEKARFPTTLVYGDTDHAALRLITCGGPIDRESGHYRDNVVVTASLVSAL